MYTSTVDGPLGPVVLTGSDDELAGVLLGPAAASGLPRDDAAFREVARQLGQWFDGARTSFDLALAAPAAPFQARVRRLLLLLPYGRTTTYGELARDLGAPGASRAVGLACGANPLGIVVPCHRVVGADGSLTGFAAGLEVKRRLLAHEQRHSGATLF